jgi:microcystin-dependent protein
MARDTFFGRNMVGQAEWERRGAATSAAASAISAALPVGVISAYYGTTAPTGWLLCDGAAIPAQYTALIALVGANTPNLKGKVIVGRDAADVDFDTLGETGGAKTVTLTEAQMPSHNHTQDSHDHTQNAHNHSTNTGTTSSNHAHAIAFPAVEDSGADAGATNRWRGAVGAGTDYPLPLSAGQDTDHHHVITSDTPGINGRVATNQSKGSGTAHNNLQPYIAVSYIIKAV